MLSVKHVVKNSNVNFRSVAPFAIRGKVLLKKDCVTAQPQVDAHGHFYNTGDITTPDYSYGQVLM